MYPFEIKARYSQPMTKLGINSNKSLNKTNSKMKTIENPAPPVIKRNANKSKVTFMKSSQSLKQPTSNTFSSAKIVPIIKKETRKRVAGRTLSVDVKNSCLNMKIDTTGNYYPAYEEEKSDLIKNDKETVELGVQTNEQEILNHLLIVGDLRILTPSKSVIDEMEKCRQQKQKIKKLSKATRKFEQHSLGDEQRLDDFKEFSDKNYITRKLPKIRDNVFEQDRKIMESMDELLQRDRPKIDSITDIKNRIRHKEQELLSLFDRFQMKQPFGKTNV